MLRLFNLAALLILLASCGSNEATNQTAAQENWVLEQDIRYRYALNAVGMPDTTFITTYYYKDGLVRDSALTFHVNKYNDQSVSYMVSYNVDKDKKVIPVSYTQYTYSPKKIMTGVTIYNSGKLARQENFVYNDSNQLVKQTIIQMIVKGSLPSGADSLPVGTAVVMNPDQISYDTVHAEYKYDQARKVVAMTYTNNKGELVRNDLNVYSGDVPLWSFAINKKGDTIQRVKYEPNGKMLHSRMENDSLVLWQNTINNVVVANKTLYKKINQLWRSAASYDQYGRKVNEKVYKNM